MFAAIRIRRSTILALAFALAYGAGFWLVLLHHAEGGHERSEPGLLLHALRDGTLALPGMLVAVWLGGKLALGMVDRHRRLPESWRGAVMATGAATFAALMLAAGSPAHSLFFDAQEGQALPLWLHLSRDAVVALAAALPLALAVVAAPGVLRAALTRARRRQEQQERSAQSGELTRRSFVAGGLATAGTVGVAGAILAHAPRVARAQASTDRLEMFINDGHAAMVDGTLVYMRGYGDAPLGDPHPSLAIEPHVFLRNRIGPIASRHYPLVAADRIPHDGSPGDAGIDPSGTGLHFIHRRHWASFFPRRVIVAETGSEIRLTITNRLLEPHTFTIDGVVDVTLGPAGSATASREVTFAAPGPGTYIYHDTENAPVNRTLGLAGALIVVPADAPWTLDGREGEFERQFVWMFHDIDPEWGRLARMGRRVDPKQTPALPRYFTINDRSGVFAAGVSLDEAENHLTHEDTKPSGHGRRVDVRNFSDPRTGTGQLIRVINTGIATHQPHWHGNHVWTIAAGNEVLSRSKPRISAEGHILLQLWEDVVELEPLTTKTVMLPLKPPPNALDVVVANQDCDWVYPMHCHAEMSQTAGGGLYPGGAVTDWILKP